jgi:hypothetical protein
LTKIDATSFYDTACLPYKKEEIEACIFLAYIIQDDKEYREALSVCLVSLSKFQQGVGVEPICLIIAEFLKAYEAGELSMDSLAHVMASDRVACNLATLSSFQKLADVEVQQNLNRLALIAASEKK